VPVVETEGVTRRYHTGGETVEALRDVDLALEAGEFAAVMGPSGSGKTTLLNVLGLLDRPSEGVVRVDGTNASSLGDRERTALRRETIGFVFQRFYLLPTLSALENVSVPRLYERARGVEERARDLLESVGLGDRVRHRPNELSGGQKQRVAIARALVNRPSLVLADEPTGNLDRETGRRILDVFADLTDRDVAVLAVTHDELVTEYTDRTIELVDGVVR
jgi:putative ABC transport system ATP-binding protein